MIKYGNLGSAIFIKILEVFRNAVVTYKTAFISEKSLLSGIDLVCLLYLQAALEPISWLTVL